MKMICLYPNPKYVINNPWCFILYPDHPDRIFFLYDPEYVKDLTPFIEPDKDYFINKALSTLSANHNPVIC